MASISIFRSFTVLSVSFNCLHFFLVLFKGVIHFLHLFVFSWLSFKVFIHFLFKELYNIQSGGFKVLFMFFSYVAIFREYTPVGQWGFREDILFCNCFLMILSRYLVFELIIGLGVCFWASFQRDRVLFLIFCLLSEFPECADCVFACFISLFIWYVHRECLWCWRLRCSCEWRDTSKEVIVCEILRKCGQSVRETTVGNLLEL